MLDGAWPRNYLAITEALPSNRRYPTNNVHATLARPWNNTLDKLFGTSGGNVLKNMKKY